MAGQHLGNKAFFEQIHAESKTMQKTGLFELQIVMTVAEMGGFRAAAVELDMSPSALGSEPCGEQSGSQAGRAPV